MEMLGTDPTDTTESPEGSTKTTTIAAIRSQSLPLPTGGSYPGGTTEFLRADQNWAVPAGGGGGGSVPTQQIIYMDELGADHTGATSCTSIFNTALSSAGTNPCLFQFGVGTYLFGTAPNSLTKNQSVAGQGSRVTNFSWAGSGPLFLATEPAVVDVWDGADNAGAFTGFSINGPFGSSATTSGIKYGALQGIRIDDVGFYGLPGGCILGYEVTSGVDWAEEAQITRLDISECGAHSGFMFGFTGTSFDYSRIDALVVVEPNIDIIALNAAEMQGLELHIRGNLHGGTANTGAVISMDRASSATSSVIGGGTFLISMEADDSTAGGTGDVGHYLLYMNAASAASQFQAQGTFFAYNEGACVSQGYYNPNNLPMAFSGFTNALNGTSPGDGDSFMVIGGTIHGVEGNITLTLAELGGEIYAEFGDVWIIQLATGTTNVIALDNALNAWGRSMKIMLCTPASGTPGAISFTVPGGTISNPTGGITIPAASKGTLVGIEWFGSSNNFGAAYQLGTGYTL